MTHQKTALVSGASGNLGSAVVACFLQNGWQVARLVHDSRAAGNPLEHCLTLTVDLTDEAAAQRSVAEAVNAFGAIDAAVLTVGGFAMGTIETTSAEAIARMIRLNFDTAYHLARPLLAHFKTQHSGKLFFIGSGQGLDTHKGKAVVGYSLSKSLLFQLANIINEDAGTDTISARVVVPGIIDTPQNRTGMPDADFNRWEKPEDIAAIIEQHAAGKGGRDKEAIIVQEALLR